MKKFLITFQEMIEEKAKSNKISTEIKERTAAAYLRLSDCEQEKCLEILLDVLQEYHLIVYFMSILLDSSKDRKVLHFLQQILQTKKYPLWARLNDMSNLQADLFIHPELYEEENEYKNLQMMYQSILDELKCACNKTLPYIPFDKRNKLIVVVIKTLLSPEHAPTKIFRHIHNCFKNMGYDVECFICYLKGNEGNWHIISNYNCFLEKTTGFDCMISDTKVTGYHLFLRSENFIEGLRHTVEMIWNKKPEFVMEIGEQTILAGLCDQFTTTVSMGCTKKMPVTTAPIIAALDRYSEEEKRRQKEILRNEQCVIETECNFLELNKEKHQISYTKKTFGLSENDFVIMIAGNRLDYEIDDTFIGIMNQIIDQNEHYVIACIGKCIKLEKRLKNDRIVFLGEQSHFREAIAVGDVFLNPPRQGGGSGGLFAILESVPVVTLGDCDVEISAGADFVCRDIRDMPLLIDRYYKDMEFRNRQKENCRKRAELLVSVDSEQNLRTLCDTVEQYALQTEQSGGDSK